MFGNPGFSWVYLAGIGSRRNAHDFRDAKERHTNEIRGCWGITVIFLLKVGVELTLSKGKED
eukprot:jgi/Psemu1/43540/gm1.43540_g